MEQETKKLLDWLIDNFNEYIQALEAKGIGEESVTTAKVCRQTIQQFLDNPNKIKHL